MIPAGCVDAGAMESRNRMDPPASLLYSWEEEEEDDEKSDDDAIDGIEANVGAAEVHIRPGSECSETDINDDDLNTSHTGIARQIPIGDILSDNLLNTHETMIGPTFKEQVRSVATADQRPIVAVITNATKALPRSHSPVVARAVVVAVTTPQDSESGSGSMAQLELVSAVPENAQLRHLPRHDNMDVSDIPSYPMSEIDVAPSISAVTQPTVTEQVNAVESHDVEHALDGHFSNLKSAAGVQGFLSVPSVSLEPLTLCRMRDSKETPTIQTEQSANRLELDTAHLPSARPRSASEEDAVQQVEAYVQQTRALEQTSRGDLYSERDLDSTHLKSAAGVQDFLSVPSAPVEPMNWHMVDTTDTSMTELEHNTNPMELDAAHLPTARPRSASEEDAVQQVEAYVQNTRALQAQKSRDVVYSPTYIFFVAVSGIGLFALAVGGVVLFGVLVSALG